MISLKGVAKLTKLKITISIITIMVSIFLVGIGNSIE
jgi:hypothetical protein